MNRVVVWSIKCHLSCIICPSWVQIQSLLFVLNVELHDTSLSWLSLIFRSVKREQREPCWMKPRTSTSLCRPWETSSLLWLKERSVTPTQPSSVVETLVLFLWICLNLLIRLLDILWCCSVFKESFGEFGECVSWSYFDSVNRLVSSLHQSIMSLNVFLLLSFSLFSTTNVRSVIITWSDDFPRLFLWRFWNDKHYC